MGNAESGPGGPNRRISVDFRASGSAINSPSASGRVPRGRTPSMNVTSFVQNLPTDMIKAADGPSPTNGNGSGNNGKFTTATISSQGVTIEEAGPKTTKAKTGSKAPTAATGSAPGPALKTPKAPKLIDMHQNINASSGNSSNNSSNTNTSRAPELSPPQSNKQLQSVTEEPAPTPETTTATTTTSSMNNNERSSTSNQEDNSNNGNENNENMDGELSVPSSSLSMNYKGGGVAANIAGGSDVDRRSLTQMTGDAKTKNAEYAKKLREAEKLKKDGEFASLEEEERKRRLENMEEQQQHEQQKSHHLNKMNSAFKTGNGLQRPQSVRRISNNAVNSSTGGNNNGNAIKVAVGAVS